MIIYKITNKINGKIYIGQTTTSLKKRWNNHCCNKQKKLCVGFSIQKYGKENFTIEEIDGANSQSELNYLEQHYIYMYNSLAPNGYNIARGGKNVTPSEVTKKKISKAGIARKCSEETRAKKRLNMLGNTHTLGFKHTEESKRKMRSTNKKKQKVIATNLITGEIFHFDSLVDASAFTKIRTQNIYKLCIKIRKPKNWTFDYA